MFFFILNIYETIFFVYFEQLFFSDRHKLQPEYVIFFSNSLHWNCLLVQEYAGVYFKQISMDPV